MVDERPRLKDMKALVTGASRGIGRACAISLAREGCDVAVNYHSSRKEALEVVDEITALGRKAVAIKADVAERSDIERMVKIIGQEIGPLDVLVNNAGIHQHLKFWELETQDWDSVMDVNLTAQWLVTKAFVEDMKQRRSGSIINISSIIGLTGTDHEIHYASSKAGVIGMTKSMALELAPFDITVNAIAPGWIETDMTADVKGSEAEDLMMRIPINRVGRPDDIARAVVFLASKDSRWMTGATLHVNGGWGMY